MHRIFKKALLVVTSLAVCAGFFGLMFHVAISQNYPAHRQMRQSLVDHPEFIPTAEMAKITSVGYDNIVADFYWLSAIQYIGSNAIGAQYKAYLAAMLGLVTDLSPHFTYPYEIGLLLLPDTNERYENLSADEQKKHIQEAKNLGNKGIQKNCDLKKIEAIRNRYDLDALFNDASLANPCTDAWIPYYMAYVSYWNDNNPEESSFWYRVAGVQSDAPKWARIMSAIMQGKTGNREKAIIMFLSLAETIDPNEKSLCRKVTGQLRNLLIPAFNGWAKLTPDFLKQVEKARVAAKKELGDKQEEIERTDVSSYCSSYLDKSVREMNLQYVQDADDRYFHDTGKHASNAKELLDLKYISYLPHDYQKNGTEFEVIYTFNKDTKHWDFEMGKYY